MLETTTLKDWFNSSYYQLLSKEKNAQHEAFIDLLIQKVQPNTKSRMLVTDCGIGKYSKNHCK